MSDKRLDISALCVYEQIHFKVQGIDISFSRAIKVINCLTFYYTTGTNGACSFFFFLCRYFYMKRKIRSNTAIFNNTSEAFGICVTESLICTKSYEQLAAVTS